MKYHVHVNNTNKKHGGEKLNTEIKKPSQLTDKERAEHKQLVATYERLDATCKRILMAYIEGMAAAGAPQSAKETA